LALETQYVSQGVVNEAQVDVRQRANQDTQQSTLQGLDPSDSDYRRQWQPSLCPVREYDIAEAG
jgi:hypothetical protein